MSDDLNRPREQEDEVEAHHAHPKLGANAEAGDEAEGGDEVVAHHAHPKLGANAEAGDEAGSDDEVEAHHHPKLARPR